MEGSFQLTKASRGGLAIIPAHRKHNHFTFEANYKERPYLNIKQKTKAEHIVQFSNKVLADPSFNSQHQRREEKGGKESTN